jgi:hypothetical protein
MKRSAFFGHLFVIFLVTACVPATQAVPSASPATATAALPAPTPVEISSFYGTPLPATLEIQDQMQTAGVGDYTWIKSRTGEVIEQIHADAFALITPSAPLPVPRSFVARLRLPYPLTPDSLRLTVFPIGDGDIQAERGGLFLRWNPENGKQHPLERQPKQEVSLSLAPGMHVLEVYAEWQDLGGVSYGFLLENPQTETADTIPEPNALTVWGWKLHLLGSENVVDTDPSLRLHEDGRLSGFTGCDNYHGMYQVAGEGFQVFDLETDGTECADPRRSTASCSTTRPAGG